MTVTQLGLSKKEWNWKKNLGILLTAVFAGYFGMAGAGPSLADVFLWYMILSMASLAEVLVCIGVIYVKASSMLAWKTSKARKNLATVIAIIVSSFAFGVLHIGYKAPFNTPPFVFGLMGIMG